MRVCWLLLLILLLSSCAQHHRQNLAALPALHLEQTDLSVDKALAITPLIDPLYLTPEMKAFLDYYVLSVPNSKQRLRALNTAIHRNGTLGLRYDGGFSGTAEEVFRSGRANCLAYSHLYIAMGRYADLDMHYQQVEVKPQWEKQGELIKIARHVNVGGKIGKTQVFTADINPQDYYRADLVYTISDEQALAQHYNNIAIEYLEANKPTEAFGHLLTALKLDPESESLWTNLGYLYRTNNQLDAAEFSYLKALELSPAYRSALQNLVTLYQMTERPEMASRYHRKLNSYHEKNPFFYAGKAHNAELDGDLATALSNIDVAITLKPEEFEFYLAKLSYLLEIGRIDQIASVEGLARKYAKRSQDLVRLDAALASNI
ncbi:MAG: tetratricopeptide repeat protein [Pseudomonadales bacterium]